MSSPYTSELLKSGNEIWGFLSSGQCVPQSAVILLVFGGHDERVAEYAARIAKQIRPKVIVVSGGFGYTTKHTFSEPEARVFAKVMESHGVDPGLVMLEESASNTGENVLFSQRLVQGQFSKGDHVHGVHKPYMVQRAITTFSKQWPDAQASVSAPSISFAAYPRRDVTVERLLNELCGQVARLLVYPELGYTTQIKVPQSVRLAARELMLAGFDNHVPIDMQPILKG